MKNLTKLFLTTLLSTGFTTNVFSQATQITSSAGNVSLFSDVLVGEPANSVLQTYLHKDRSYECALLQSIFTDQTGIDGDDFRIFNTTITDPDGQAITGTANGNTFPQMAKIKSLNNGSSVSDSEHARLRYSLIPSKTGLFKFSTADALSNNGFYSYPLRCL